MTPLQFSQAEMADCRIYYMPNDIISVENTWTRIVNGFKNGGKGLCVNGGLQIISSNSTINGTNGISSPAASSPSTAYMGVASMTTVSKASLLAGIGLVLMGFLL